MVKPTPHSPWERPWPAQTPVPQAPEPSTSRRKRSSSVDRRKLLSAQRRQGTSVPDQDAIGSCSLSLYPPLPSLLVSLRPRRNQPGLNLLPRYGSLLIDVLTSHPLPQTKQNKTVKCFLETTFSRVTQHRTPQLIRTSGRRLSVRAKPPFYCSRCSHQPQGNSRLPQYAQTNSVNIYLFHGDSGEQVFSSLGYPNPTNRAGDITALVNDTWWGSRGQDYKGQNISYLFYWVITPSSQSLDSGYLPQATFTAVRKFLPMTCLPSAHPYFTQPACFPMLTET